MIAFAQPWWLVAGIISCLLLWPLWLRQDRRRRRQLAGFAAPVLLGRLTSSVCETRRRIKKLLVLGAVFCCFIALARPQYGFQWIDVNHQGIDILFALDTSRSMLAQDIRPNRLERSKLAILDFVDNLRGDRVGLLPFAGSAHLLCPLTADYQAFERSLLAVDTTIIPVGGTDLGGAIRAAETVLANQANHKILVIVTDGEDLQQNGIAAAGGARARGVTIFTVGVGTTAGELLPDQQTGGFIKDETGSYVHSRLDRETLVRIGEAGGGFYGDLGSQGEGLARIYRDKLARIPKTELAEKRMKVPVPRSEWPLALALILLCGDFLLSARKPETTLPRALARLAHFRRYQAALLLPLATAVAAFFPATGQTSTGERFYESGDYPAAAAFYQEQLEKDPDNPVLLYNSGTAAYKNQRFEEAAESFDRALASADPDLQEKIYFNKGNALYRTGEAVLPADPQRAAQRWEQALTAYAGALALNPDNRDAADNRDFVGTRLEQLRQQQRNKEPPPPDRQEHQSADEQAGVGSDEDAATQSEQTEPSGSTEPAATLRQETPAEAQEQGRQDEQADRERHEDHAGAGDQDAEPSRDVAAATREGAMTPEEARQLLQAIENGEGRLDLLVPTPGKDQTENRKDW